MSENIRIGDCVSRDILVGATLLHLVCTSLRIQSNLNKLAEWCEANALKLNAGKFKSITFSSSLYPVEFLYLLEGVILDRVDSISVLGVCEEYV
jgi:hypothetical protein